MSKIFDYLKIVVLLIGVLVGIQVPGFVDQYGKNLASRVSESDNSISRFQNDADKYFSGDIDKLIQHYRTTSDPVIASGGESIESLFVRNRSLLNAYEEFTKSTYSSYYHVTTNPVQEIMSDTWQRYTHSVVLNSQAIIAGIICAVTILVLFELLIFLLVLPARKLKSGATKSKKRPKSLKV